MRDLGSMGESIFATWSAQVGVANKSNNDKTGWDFVFENILELDGEKPPEFPLDKLPTPLKCFIQVKSTDNQYENQDISLSHCQRFIGSGDPVFILVLEFDGLEECQRAYLVHVGNEYIRRIKKRLREVNTSDIDKLHKMTITFSYGEEDRLPSLNGSGLQKTIFRHIGVRPELYARNKLEYAEKVGYEGPMVRCIFQLKFSGEESLVDWALGETSLDYKGGIIETDIRFNIAGRREQLDHGKLLIEAKPAHKGILSFRVRNNSLKIPVDIIVPSPKIIPLNSQAYKIRCQNSFLTMFIAVNNNVKSKWTVKLPDPHSDVILRDSYISYKLYLMLAQAKAEDLPCIVDLFINENIVFEGGNIQFEKPEPHLIDYSTTMDRAWIVAKYCDCHDELKLKPIELLENQAILQGIYSWINNITVPTSIAFYTSEIDKEHIQMCCPVIIRLPFGQYCISMSMIIFGVPILTGNKNESLVEYNLNSEKIDVLNLVLEERNPEIIYLSPLLDDEIHEKYKDSHTILIIEAICK